MVKKAIDGGAIGIAVGRNVWQHPQPSKIAKALHAIVHDAATVDSALKCLS
jgi:DhnA family fructose-bisphosphate aldolase class Ia